jgi:EpsI family protein
MQAEIHKKFFAKIHLSFIISALILLYWHSFAYWIHTWTNNFDYRFGFIMPLLSFYVVWKRRELFQFAQVKSSNSGILIIVIGLFLYGAGQAAHIKVAQQASFFIVIPGIILYYFGFKILRLLSPPLVILLFMAPIPDFFHSYLQEFFTWASVDILRLFNAPVYAEGYCIQLPTVAVRVASGCTGIRFLTGLFPIGLAISYLHFNSRRKKVFMVLFSAILPMLANLFRIVTLLIFALMGNDIFVSGAPHKIQGYIVFVGALFILFGFASFLNRFGTEPIPEQNKIVNENPLSQFWNQGFSSYRNFILIVFALLIPALIHARLQIQSITPLGQSFRSFPMILGEWRGCELSKNEWRPKVIGATDNLNRLYKDADGNEIKVFVSYLPFQKQGQELVFHANKIIPPEFVNISESIKSWTINANPHAFELKTAFLPLNRGTRQEMLLYWYRNAGRYSQSKYQAKISMILDSLLHKKSHGSVFVLKVKCSSHKAKVWHNNIQRFLNNFMPEISKYLPS